VGSRHDSRPNGTARTQARRTIGIAGAENEGGMPVWVAGEARQGVCHACRCMQLTLSIHPFHWLVQRFPLVLRDDEVVGQALSPGGRHGVVQAKNRTASAVCLAVFGARTIPVIFPLGTFETGLAMIPQWRSTRPVLWPPLLASSESASLFAYCKTCN
jgi:hypothetical protein